MPITIFWKDGDEDRIDIKDEYSLLLAMNSMGGPVYTLFVIFENTIPNSKHSSVLFICFLSFDIPK